MIESVASFDISNVSLEECSVGQLHHNLILLSSKRWQTPHTKQSPYESNHVIVALK